MKVDLSCPIELWEYELPTVEKPVISFTFFNLSKKLISSIQITVTSFDENDVALSKRKELPMALEAAPRAPFVVELPAEDEGTEALDLVIDKVWFEDGSEWRRQQDVRLVDYEPNELPPNRKLEHLRYVAGSDAVGFPSDQGKIWICVCGRVNADDEYRCRRCDRDKAQVFEAFSPQAVQAAIDRREAELEEKARMAREEASRQEFMRQDKARRKRRARRTRTAVISVVLVVGVLAYLFVVLGLPELRYQTATAALAANDLTAAREGFEELMDYRDSAQMVSECDFRLASEYASSGDMAMVDEAIGMFESLGNYPGALEMADEAAYQKGQLYLEAKDYENASATFATLTGYRDSSDLVNQAEYQMAKQAMDAKNYDEAARRFGELGNYLDAAALQRECIYRPAMALMNEGNYDEATEMFGSIVGYKDADEQRKQSIYQSALKAQLSGDYDYAAERFLLLGDYSDSSDQHRHSIYLAAGTARDNGKYETAIKLYTSVIDYLDSADQIKLCTYMPATALMTEGRYEEAAALFKTIFDYQQSEELYYQCIYIPAEEAVEAGEYDTAIALYEQIPEYSDVSRKLQQAQYKRAEKLEADGAYEDAIAAFEALGEYTDAADRVKGAQYKLAEEAFEAGHFSLASERFEALGRYSDAQTRVKECAYELAMLLFDAKEYRDAYDAFTAIEDYDAAKTKAQESAYALGEALTAEGDLEGAAEAFGLAGRYEDAADRMQESIYNRATALKDTGEYQAAGDLFDSITGYSDARAQRDESYDLWLKEKFEQAQEAYDEGDFQTVVTLLKDLDIGDLPKAYAALQTMYYDSNLKIARQLINEDRALDAYAYLIAANGYRTSSELLDKNIYRILGTWETEDGVRYAFYLNGTALINGETVYFNMFNPYGISVGETNDPDDMVRILDYSSATDNMLQLRETGSEKTFRLTRVKPPEVSETNDSGGSQVLSDAEAARRSEPVIDVIEASEGEADEPTPSPSPSASATPVVTATPKPDRGE